MSETSNIRFERIQKLFKELEYEIARGMMDDEIDETLGFEFYVPISRRIKDGVVHCIFKTRPIPRYSMRIDFMEPRLKVIK